MNIRTAPKKQTRKNGDVVICLRARCNACRRVIEMTGEALERKKLRKRIHYHTHVKTNPELMEKKRQLGRKRAQEIREYQRQQWEKMIASNPQHKYFPPSTSKFAAKIYIQVLDALQSYNIRFLAEFNYLYHHLYKKTSDKTERGLRADLLVEIDLEGREKPLTVVIEAQG